MNNQFSLSSFLWNGTAWSADYFSLRGRVSVAGSQFLDKIFNKAVFFNSQTLLLYNDFMKTENQHQTKKIFIFQMPFQAFLHINVLLIEFSFECGWLHITWGWMYALWEEKKKASRCHAPIFWEHFSTLHFSSDLDIADITACQLAFCKQMYAKLCEI